MKFSTAVAHSAVVLVAGSTIIWPSNAEPSQLRGVRKLQDDGQPSDVITEEGDYHPSPNEDCQFLAAEHLIIPKGREGHRRLDGDSDDVEYGCGFPDGTVADMSGLTLEQRSHIEEGMTQGMLESGVSHIDLGAAGATVTGSRVTFPPGFNVAGNARGRGRNQRQGGGSGNSAAGRRRLAQLEGNKYTLVVKGKFIDYPWNSKSPAILSSDVFGTELIDGGDHSDPVNLSSQLKDCSFGKLLTVPGPDPTWNSGAFTSLEGIEAAPGVIEIDMGVNMNGMSKSAIYNLFVSKTTEALGAAVTSLPGPFDHVIFARETCLTECGWAAYAYVNAWGQMFQGNYISQTGVQVHEMGHNLNLAHSGSQGISWSGGSVGSGGYTDHTCSMGNPLYSDDVGKMCFNPAKNYQINGWYNDAKVTLDPGGKNGPPSPTWEGDVIGVGEYNLRTDQPVTIKIETGTPQDFFVGFNRAAGPNAQNDLADNKVNVIQVDGNDGNGYSQSQLRAILEPGASYSEIAVPGIVDYADLKIKVNSIDSTSTPWKANMRIGFDQCTDDTWCTKSCFTSRCDVQGAQGANVLGCIDDPIMNCCGNGICEGGETSTTCADDCLAGPTIVQPDDCSSCWIRNGAMFDVEAKPDADLIITGIEYKAYTNSGNVRLYYRVGGKAGYASGTNLLSNGWVYVTQAIACGAWTYCSIGAVNIDVPRGTRVGILVAYDNGGDVLYYNTNYGPTSDEYITVHEGSAVDFDSTAEYANNFHNALMFSGKITYMADLTDPFQCAVDGDCDNGEFCDGAETCANNQCLPGTAPSCSGLTPFCSEVLDQCVACLSDGDCADSDLCNGAETCNASGQCVAGTAVDCDDSVPCTVDFCTPSTGLCTNSPNHLYCSDEVFCNGAETCDALAGCQNAFELPCSGSAPFCNEDLGTCLECLSGADCDDGNLCNGVETCDNNQCVAGTAVTCNDSVGCTVDTCDSATGTCSYAPNDDLCDNGSFCDGAETCDAVNDCQVGTQPCSELCSETLDQCVSCLADTDCDNGEFCDGAETCNASGSCVSGVPPGCSGGTPFCSETLNQCAECLFGADCDDGVACTDDICAEGTCSSTPNDANCPNEGEVCDASAGCQAQATVYACSKNQPLQAEACAATSNANCESNPNSNCANGGKVCWAFTCAVTPSPPTNPPAPTPPTPPTNPPVPVCAVCAATGEECCGNCIAGGKPANRGCFST